MECNLENIIDIIFASYMVSGPSHFYNASKPKENGVRAALLGISVFILSIFTEEVSL